MYVLILVLSFLESARKFVYIINFEYAKINFLSDFFCVWIFLFGGKWARDTCSKRDTRRDGVVEQMYNTIIILVGWEPEGC